MSAGVSHSIPRLLHATEEQQMRALLAVASACPGIDFYDALHIGDAIVTVRVHGTPPRVDRLPPHAPAAAGTAPLTLSHGHMAGFEDLGDVLLPGWDPERHATEAVLAPGDEPTWIGSLEAWAREIDADIAAYEEEPPEDDPTLLEDLGRLREVARVALRDRLPVVAHW